MTTALAVLALTALVAAVVAGLESNHRRATAWPAADDASDRDAVRLRADLTGVSHRPAAAPLEPRQVRRQLVLQSSVASRS